MWLTSLVFHYSNILLNRDACLYKFNLHCLSAKGWISMEFAFFSYFQRTLLRRSSEKALSCWNVNYNSEQQSPVLLNSDNSAIAFSSLSASASSFPSHALLPSPSISLPLTLAASLSFSKALEGSAITFGADQKRGSLQWNKSLHNSCGEMALIADWFEAEAADICKCRAASATLASSFPSLIIYCSGCLLCSDEW